MTETLDHAFTKAEALLPDGWFLWVGRGGSGYTARADPPRKRQTAVSLKANGPTPTEALNRLSTELLTVWVLIEDAEEDQRTAEEWSVASPPTEELDR